MILDSGKAISYQGCPFELGHFHQESFVVRCYFEQQGHSPPYHPFEKPNWLVESESVCAGVEREAREEEVRGARRVHS